MPSTAAVDDVVAERGADVAGVVGGVAGVVRVVRAHVVGAAGAGGGQAPHIRRWHCWQVIRDRSGYRCRPARRGGVGRGRCPRFGLPPGRLPTAPCDQGGVLVAVGGPGPVLARHRDGLCARPGACWSPALRVRPSTTLPVYLGLRRMCVDAAGAPRLPVRGRARRLGQPAGDAVAVQLLIHPPFEDPGDPRAAFGVGDQPGAGRAHRLPSSGWGAGCGPRR